MVIVIVVLIVALLAVIALAAWERERSSLRHRDERDELQARIDALAAATTTIPEMRRVYSEMSGKVLHLRPSSSWYDAKPDVAPMRVLDDEEVAHPTKKAGT